MYVCITVHTTVNIFSLMEFPAPHTYIHTSEIKRILTLLIPGAKQAHSHLFAHECLSK